jgi:hypothetical protein
MIFVIIISILKYQVKNNDVNNIYLLLSKTNRSCTSSGDDKTLFLYFFVLYFCSWFVDDKVFN